jgi:hypothetical protein
MLQSNMAQEEAYMITRRNSRQQLRQGTNTYKCSVCTLECICMHRHLYCTQCNNCTMQSCPRVHTLHNNESKM